MPPGVDGRQCSPEPCPGWSAHRPQPREQSQRRTGTGRLFGRASLPSDPRVFSSIAPQAALSFYSLFASLATVCCKRGGTVVQIVLEALCRNLTRRRRAARPAGGG